MKRRDFIKTVGIGCIGCCCNPLEVLAGSSRAAARSNYFKAGCASRISTLSSYKTAFASPGGRSWDKNKLLQQYDAGNTSRRAMYVTVFDEAKVDGILDEMRDSYEALIPDMPYIGELNYHLQWDIPNAEKLAEFKVAKTYGLSVKDFSSMYLDWTAQNLRSQYTDSELVQIGNMQFGLMADIQLRIVAFISQLKVYPEDYILKYVKGDGKDFDWGLDYTQCPSEILYRRHDELNLLFNVICRADYVAGSLMKVGYHRSQTIVEGYSFCDLRWKQGKESVIPGYTEI
ncbi:MAG: hypothetical protein WCQ99_05720 [Pseudomonadota bacterium]